MSPTEKGRLKGLRQARELALAQAKAAEEASKQLEPFGVHGMGPNLDAAVARVLVRRRFAEAHAQALRALARKLQRQINQALRGTQAELLP